MVIEDSIEWLCVLCFKQKTAYEMRISDWSSDVCSSDLFAAFDLNKMLGDLKMPGFDPAAVAAAQQKNIDAITAANKRAIEGYQAIAKRQAEIFQISGESRVGEECVRTGRYRGWPSN